MLLCSVTAGWTQTDPAKMLVGRWTGEIETATGVRDRTLIIKSIEEQSGQRVAIAEYGDPGPYAGSARLAPVKGEIEVINGEIVLRFLTADRGRAMLTLYKDGKHLTGPVSGARPNQVGRSQGGDDNLRLRKVE